MESEEEILTTKQAAALLGISVGQMGKWLVAGHFPNAYRLNPNLASHWRIPRSDVNEFIQLRRKLRGYYRMPAVAVVSDR
jgi:excisionase family DNA binding protein